MINKKKQARNNCSNCLCVVNAVSLKNSVVIVTTTNFLTVVPKKCVVVKPDDKKSGTAMGKTQPSWESGRKNL